MKAGKWGFEDKDGNKIVPNEYDYVTEFNTFGFAGVRKDQKWGVINENGEIVCECKYDFGETLRPEFIGKYYKTYTEYDEVVHYSDEVS